MEPLSQLPVLGWSEWAQLPGLGSAWILAKIDTGARSCALHVESLRCFDDARGEQVAFVLHHGPSGLRLECCLPVADRRVVVSSNGGRQERVFVRTVLRLGDWAREVELNLADRHGLRHPMLIGRSALAQAWRVDPGRRFLLGNATSLDPDAAGPVSRS